ncbi:sensor histidine kinase [Chloroflexota bacterium]
MTGEIFLDWATMGVSLFNTILLIWLGLTVLLNAERRTWGIWLAGGGLLLGAAFFLSHTAILGHGPNFFSPGVNFWWHLGWIPVILSPFAWYTIMLWYAGYWKKKGSQVRRRHRIWFTLASLITGLMTITLIFANPLPSFVQVAMLNLTATPSIGGIPILILFYPLFIIGCMGLAMDALMRPAPPLRAMGDLARRRARPWLVGATFALLLASFLVGAFLMWVVVMPKDATYYTGYTRSTYGQSLARLVAWFDLVIASLIAVSIVLTGQAIVSYEVFTGKSLPRRGLMRYWRRAVILAFGYGAGVGLSLMLPISPIYSLLLSTCLMIAFYALLGWRSFAEREHLITNLGPFLSSQSLYEQLLNPGPIAGEVDLMAPFGALCRDLLEARLAYLIPLGAQAPLFGSALTYPKDSSPDLLKLAETLGHYKDSRDLFIPLSPGEIHGAAWAVPLRNSAGALGVLLLGEKANGGLYTQEEIEFARSVCERLVDLQVSAELARRLMALQRQRLVESQVIDRQTRRILHDDVLPRLHAATLSLDALSDRGKSSEIISTLSGAHRQLSDLLRDMPATTAPEVRRQGLIGALQHLTRGELGHAFDLVNWQVDPGAIPYTERIQPIKAEVLFYAAREAIRNAAQHARDEAGGQALELAITIDRQTGLTILIEDNGMGIRQSEEKVSGSGHGLALHSTMLAVIGASLSIESTPGAATRIRIHLPEENIDEANLNSPI